MNPIMFPLLLASLLSLQRAASAQDPCTVYSVLPWEGRMTANVVRDASKMQCDISLREAWYRVMDGPAGSDMPTSCPAPFNCGTKSPVWLNGTLPDQEDLQVEAMACVRSLTRCCSKTFPILIKNCSSFNVYKLHGSNLSCDSAFCFGIHDPCPPGESSETGYQPGCSGNFPNLAGPAEVAFDPRWETAGNVLYFHCNPAQPPDPVLVYDVRWYYNNKVIHSVTALPHGQTHMSDKHWFKDGRKMGFNVSCQIRARNESGSTPSPWLRSPAKFVGIKILTTSVTIPENGHDYINFTLTVPFACDPAYNGSTCSITIGFDQSSQVADCQNPAFTLPDRCQEIVERQSWNETHRFRLLSKNDGIVRRRVTAYVRLQTTDLDGYPTWSKYSLPPVLVVITDVDAQLSEGVSCESNNDPHITTFDKYYSKNVFHPAGEFLLYRNKDFPVEIHAIFAQCPGRHSPSCNCGVAVRAGYDLYAIHHCNGYPNEGEVTCGGLGHLHIFDKDGGKIKKIILPTGGVLWVKPSFDNFINLQLDASMVDVGKTEGICGNFDSLMDDDEFALQPSQQNRFRIPSNESFFTEKKRLPPWDGHAAAVCTCNVTGDRKPELNCDWRRGVTSCLPPEYRDLTCHKRSKREVLQDDYLGFDFEDVGIIEEASTDVDLTWKGNWTETKARQFCEDYLQKSAFVQTCQTSVGLNVVSSVDICIADIQLTGDVQWAMDALEHAKGLCMKEVLRDPKYFESDNTTTGNSSSSSPSLKDSLDAVGCSRDCNGNGDCIEGHCRCHSGYLGATCDVSATAAPDVMAIPRGGLCDVTARPCRMTAVLGSSFVQSSQLTCRLARILVNESGMVEVGEVHQMPGVFESYGEVLCPTHSPRERRDTRSGLAASGAHGFLVSVANDAVNFGAPKPFVIFDSRCLQCQQSSASLNCSLKPDTCFIEGACYVSGERKFGQACVSCSPAHSRTEWQLQAGSCWVEGGCHQDGDPKPGDQCYICDSSFSPSLWKSNPACTDRKLWIIGVVLGSVLVLVVALVVCWRFKMNRKMKVKVSNPDPQSPPSSSRKDEGK